MAISTDLPGVNVTITINDQALPEHILPDLDQVARTTDRLVEAQSNQVFEIQMHADPTTNFHGSQLAFKIFVDGRYIEKPLISQVPGGWTEKSEGMHFSPGQVRKYQFMDLVAVAEHTTSLSSRSTSMRSAISRASSSMDQPMPAGLPTPPTSIGQATTSVSTAPRPRMSESRLTPTMSSDPDLPSFPRRTPNYSENDLAELGTIKIVVSHVNLATSVGFVRNSHYHGGRQVAETGKGQVSQKVGFTAPQKTAAVSHFGTTDVAGVSNPAATFIFHYRAKEAIEAFLALSKSDEDVTIKKEESEDAKVKQEPALSTSHGSGPIKEENREGVTAEREAAGLEAIPEFIERPSEEEEDRTMKQKPDTTQPLDLGSPIDNADDSSRPQNECARGEEAAGNETAELQGREGNDQVKKRKPSQDLQAIPKSIRLEAENAADDNK
ncbi:hypothetical protein AC579_2821 [Pseudocercospora musae]|uniref:DUF7918 domain-containing protein n=1 Tax=Pseudocercospora musae TaxID=113226 RepID=A0A139IL14_9PEZI|nr:hypothetical protein AC579_2821 [Pseudocercospora musae]